MDEIIKHLNNFLESSLFVIIIFCLSLFIFGALIYISQKIANPEYSEYRRKVSDWEEKNPMWAKLGSIGVIFGPSYPPFEKNKCEE